MWEIIDPVIAILWILMIIELIRYARGKSR